MDNIHSRLKIGIKKIVFFGCTFECLMFKNVQRCIPPYKEKIKKMKAFFSGKESGF